jgi:spore maturation protein CgeB
MKILVSVLGNIRTIPMNLYVPRTLEAMGHEVSVLDSGVHGIIPGLLKKFSSRQNLTRFMDNKTLGAIERYKPDIFLAIYGVNHSIELIDKVKAMGIPAACWWLNDPFQFKRSTERAASFDFYFTNSRGSLEDYRAKGITNVHYLPVGIYPPVHRRLAGLEKKYDVSFSGDWCAPREKVLGAVAEDFDLAIFGPWKKKLREGAALRKRIVKNGFFTAEEMVGIFNRSRVVLNLHSWFGRFDYGVNPRLFEANGCGAFQLCDWKEEIAGLYEDGKEVVLYRTVEELKKKLAYYLPREKERAVIADNALKRSLECHTYEHRMKRLLKVCGL